MVVRSVFFFFNDTATTEIYTLSLHDALPIWGQRRTNLSSGFRRHRLVQDVRPEDGCGGAGRKKRSEEDTSELQSPAFVRCPLLLEKKKENHPAPLSHADRTRPSL